VAVEPNDWKARPSKQVLVDLDTSSNVFVLFVSFFVLFRYGEYFRGFCHSLIINMMGLECIGWSKLSHG
jgi:hypothetical protein